MLRSPCAPRAIEVDPKYCELLRRRAASAGSSDGTGLFNVTCKRYQDVTVDADYYTWWNQRPHLLNLAVLLQLAHDVSKGKIRSSARALVLSNSPKCSGTETRSESCRLLDTSRSESACRAFRRGRAELHEFNTEAKAKHKVLLHWTALCPKNLTQWNVDRSGDSFGVHCETAGGDRNMAKERCATVESYPIYIIRFQYSRELMREL